MAFSYSAVWEDATRLLRENARLLAAIAGVFIFLPGLLAEHYLPAPEPVAAARLVDTMAEYYSDNWLWVLLQTLVSMIGTAAMLRLVLVRGTSVAGALAFGLMLLPFYFLLSISITIMVFFGFALLIVPGLYLIGRLVPAAPIMVAEDRRNPIEVIGRSFAITKGRGWAVFGIVFIVGLVGLIAMGVARTLLGLGFILVAGRELGTLLAEIAGSAFAALLATLMLALYAAIYRALVTD
ncbi:MAG TPA: hypothetical protein VES64_10380 [Allosphingosinicella sp.]|nr:hypothetical protein [Allosphingosinicella sp.]